MTCVRCYGLMIDDSFEDLRDDTHQFRFAAWRCLNCGEVMDSVIIGHRLKMEDRDQPRTAAQSNYYDRVGAA